jgi:hypothetical protein
VSRRVCKRSLSWHASRLAAKPAVAKLHCYRYGIQQRDKKRKSAASPDRFDRFTIRARPERSAQCDDTTAGNTCCRRQPPRRTATQHQALQKKSAVNPAFVWRPTARLANVNNKCVCRAYRTDDYTLMFLSAIRRCDPPHSVGAPSPERPLTRIPRRQLLGCTRIAHYSVLSPTRVTKVVLSQSFITERKIVMFIPTQTTPNQYHLQAHGLRGHGIHIPDGFGDPGLKGRLSARRCQGVA